MWFGGLRLKDRELHWYGLGRLQRMLVNSCVSLFLNRTSLYPGIGFNHASIAFIRAYME